MLTLVCVVVGEGRPFSVKIEENETVGDLKNLIKVENNNTISCDAKDLELYRVDGLAQISKTQFDFNGAVIDDMPLKLLSYFNGPTTEMIEAFKLSSYPERIDFSSVGEFTYWWCYQSPAFVEESLLQIFCGRTPFQAWNLWNP
ncbi:hypothetical protein THRCLA_21511 [Thraustotheca clavata]|uniref:Crinkler effector protein N-terminal domain-containing protein n=1 Tax=Thraustotheca clavata TaxID=74557 RepID=A0A1V9ZVM7_9STRA|nr:hypothetical protein THRCLA_21511 [Thraustotheca clavata]